MKKYLFLQIMILSTILTYNQGYELVWADEFDADTINTEKWNFEIGNGAAGWGNNESQYYTKRSQNIRIENGLLIVTALKESYSDFQYTSARMQTRNKSFCKYGRIEMKAKLPHGRGTWAAFWMMPQQHNYGTNFWPDNGEIDIMEYVGYMPGTIYGTVHTYKNNGAGGVSKSITRSGIEDEFHIYAIEWSEESIKWYVDSIFYGSYERLNRDWQFWPFDQDFYIIVNYAIGGNWGGANGIDDSIFPQTYEIDYIRVYRSVNANVLKNNFKSAI
jgi:beta-glucanase (GH16 family)